MLVNRVSSSASLTGTDKKHPLLFRPLKARRSAFPRVYGDNPELPEMGASNGARSSGSFRGRSSLASFMPCEDIGESLQVEGIVQPLIQRRLSVATHAPWPRSNVRPMSIGSKRSRLRQREGGSIPRPIPGRSCDSIGVTSAMMTMQVKAPSRSPRVYRGSVAVKGALFDQAETRTEKVMEATEEPLQIVARESTEVKVASCDTRRRSKSFNRGLTLADTASPFSKNRAVLLAALAKEEGVDSLAPGHLVSYADAIQSVEGKCYSMVLCAGNNHTMIERMLSQTRPWWRVVVTSQNSYSEFCSSIFNLKWKQSLPNATDTLRRMANAVDLGGATVCQPQLVNYFGGCHELCTKANLLRNLAKYCGEVKINLWEIMPVSIIIRLKRCDADADQDSTPCGLEDYVLATEVITRVASLGATERTTIDLKGDFPSSNDQICVRVPSSLCTGNNRFLLRDGENHHPYSVSRLITSRVATSPSSMLAGLTVKYSMPSSFIPESSNMAPQWMLKPAALSRGRGIKVIRTEAELRRFVLKKDSPHSKALRRVISSGLPERSSIRRGRSLSVGPLVGKSKTRRSLSTKVSEACQPCVAEKREEEKVERLRSNSMASTAASSSPSNSKEEECLSTVQEGDGELSEASPMITVARESSIPVVSKVRKTEGKKGSNGNWVLQKYIDRPMLINQRKFDIRMWLVLTPSLHAYCYREGYIRTASVSYDPSRENSVVDEMMHLCNNAIQKRGDKYGLYENGNQMSFDALQAYADENAGRPNCPSKLDVHGKMRAAMYRAMAISLHATLRQFRSPNSNSFQIFGYDFMIDQDGGVWLIEVNSNPCLAESSTILEDYVPEMLNGVFSLCVDPYARPHGTAASHRPEWRKLRSDINDSVRNKFDLICCGRVLHSGVDGIDDSDKVRFHKDTEGPLARSPTKYRDSSFTCRWCNPKQTTVK